MVQPIGLLSRFADHTFITCQQINVIFLKQVLIKELPEHLRPGNNCIVKALDRAVAAAFPGPARQTQHRNPSRHAQHRSDNPAHLTECSLG